MRNREAILCAARRLVDERGADAITMDALAAAAGVGTGTLFRHFGDRAGLFHALLDESERRLQEGIIRGPAPLGPGAPPAERLEAFGHALIAFTADRAELLLAASPPLGAPRYASPVFQAYWGHLWVLLEPVVGPPRASYLADVLLSALTPELVVHQLRRGSTLGELQTRFSELVADLLGGD